MPSQNIRQDLLNIENELMAQFVERDTAIRAMIRAVLSMQHMSIIGAPGIAKSALVDKFSAKIINAKFFDIMMRRDSTCDEMFGSVSLKGLENGHYIRNVTDMLPESDFAFLDEGYKANSTVLNGTLKIMNERKFKNNSSTLNCPLKSMFVASNEMPQSEDLNAFWDRTLVRLILTDIQEDSAFLSFLETKSGRGALSADTKIDLKDLEQAIKEVSQVTIPADVTQALVILRRKLHAKGIKPSPRRFAACMEYMKAEAWMDGRNEVATDDVTVLENCLWETKEQFGGIAQILSEIASPDLGRVTEILDAAKESFDTAMASTDPTALVEANAKLKKAYTEIEKLSRLSTGKAKSKALLGVTNIQNWNTNLLKKLGVTSFS